MLRDTFCALCTIFCGKDKDGARLPLFRISWASNYKDKITKSLMEGLGCPKDELQSHHQSDC